VQHELEGYDRARGWPVHNEGEGAALNATTRGDAEMAGMTQRLYAHLEEQGLKGRAVPVRRLRDLQAEIEGRHTGGLFDEEFYRERMTFFRFSPPDDFPSAASLLAVALPRPKTRILFTWRGETRELILPPTYQGYLQTAQRTGELLARWLSPEGYRVAPARLPNKALAVGSGLAEYGRNNITYIQGMGSFFQLVVFYSNMPSLEDPWREPRMMDRCEGCRACLVKCPTGAITAERFLFHAERCIVFHNERGLEHPFPTWIDPASHNSLMGCMICQQYCPEDKDFLRWIEGDVAFSHEETSLLLTGPSPDLLPAATRAKLEHLELLDSLEILPRNLGVFFNRA
jgi:epoxyqueuosine reductase